MTVRGANRPEPPPDPATLKFMLDYAKGEPENQRAVHQSLGTKAVQLFSVATVVIGLAAAGPLEDAGTTAGWLIVSAVVADVLHAICALNALLPRQLRVSVEFTRFR